MQLCSVQSITSGQNKLTKGRIAAHGWFSGIRPVAPVCTQLNTCFFGFTLVSDIAVFVLNRDAKLQPTSLGLTQVHNPSTISIRSAIFAQLMPVLSAMHKHVFSP